MKTIMMFILLLSVSLVAASEIVDTTYLRISIDKNTIPYMQDYSLPIHISYTQTSPHPQVNLSSSITGEFSKNNWIVDPQGEDISLFIKKSKLKLGENTISITAENNGTILGSIECILVVDEVVTVPEDVIYKDGFGGTEDFTISLTNFGKEYFENEPIEVIAGTSVFRVYSGKPWSGSYDISVIHLESMDTVFTRTVSFGNHLDTDIYLPREGKYEVIMHNTSSTNITNVACGVQKAGKLFSINGFFDVTFDEILDTLYPPFDNNSVTLSVETVTEENGKIATLRGVNSGKKVTSPHCITRVAYQFITLAKNAPLYEIKQGIIDTVSGNIWVWDGYNLARWNGSNWTKYAQENGWFDSTSLYVKSVSIASNGSAWITTTKGVAVQTGDDWKYYTSELSDSSSIQEVRFDGEAAYLVYSSGVSDKIEGPFISNLVSTPTETVTGAVNLVEGYKKIYGQYGYVNDYYGHRNTIFQYAIYQSTSIEQPKHTLKEVPKKSIEIMRSGSLITLSVQQQGNYQIDLFNLQGRKVGTLDNRIFLKGNHSIDINHLNISKGIYIVSITSVENRMLVTATKCYF